MEGERGAPSLAQTIFSYKAQTIYVHSRVADYMKQLFMY